MIQLKIFTYKKHNYICHKDAHLGFYKIANVVFEDGKIVFIDYTSKSVTATINKFKQVTKYNPSK